MMGNPLLEFDEPSPLVVVNGMAFAEFRVRHGRIEDERRCTGRVVEGMEYEPTRMQLRAAGRTIGECAIEPDGSFEFVFRLP